MFYIDKLYSILGITFCLNREYVISCQQQIDWLITHTEILVMIMFGTKIRM